MISSSNDNCFKKNAPCIFLGVIVLSLSPPIIYAENTYEEKVEFATSMQEILAYLNGAQIIYKYGNHEMARHHMNYPFLETYPKISDELEIDVEYNKKLEFILHIMKNLNLGLSDEKLKEQMYFIEKILNEGEDLIISQELQDDPKFKKQVVTQLLERAKIKLMESLVLTGLEHHTTYEQGLFLVNQAKIVFNSLEE